MLLSINKLILSIIFLLTKIYYFLKKLFLRTLILSNNRIIYLFELFFSHIIIVRRQQIKKNFSNSFLKKLRYLSYNEIQYNLE